MRYEKGLRRKQWELSAMVLFLTSGKRLLPITFQFIDWFSRVSSLQFTLSLIGQRTRESVAKRERQTDHKSCRRRRWTRSTSTTSSWSRRSRWVTVADNLLIDCGSEWVTVMSYWWIPVVEGYGNVWLLVTVTLFVNENHKKVVDSKFEFCNRAPIWFQAKQQ